MTDQPDRQSEVVLRAEFVGERAGRLVTSLVASGGATILTPKIEKDWNGDEQLVLELVTASPAGELADVLELVVQGLREGVVVEAKP